MKLQRSSKYKFNEIYVYLFLKFSLLWNHSKEAQILKSEGVNILIALGHSGIDKDKMIAAKCDDIDLVVGGHCMFPIE